MKKKSIVLFSLLFAAALSVTACGSETVKEEKPEENSVAVTEAAEDAEETEEVTEAVSETEAVTEAEEPAADPKPLSEILAEIEKPEVKSVSLKEVGKLGDGIDHYGEFLYKKVSDEEIQCLDFKGNPLLEGKVTYVEKLGDTGLFAYYTVPENDITYGGLMEADGTVVLGTDAKVGTFEKVNERYVKAYLPEAVTTNKDEAIYFATSRQFALDVKDGDVLYTGTVKLYDTKEHKFLENTAQKFDPNYSVGSEIITFSDKDHNKIAVSADDKLIDIEGKTVVGDLITEYKDSKTTVYDKDMKKLFTTEYSLSDDSESDDFYSFYDGTNRGIIHKSGTVVIDAKYKFVSYVGDGVFSFEHDDINKKGLVSADGKELTKEEYKSFRPAGVPGYFSAKTQDDKNALIDTEGNVILSGQESSFTEDSYFSSTDGYSYFVANKKDAPLKLETSGSYFGNHLLYNSNEKAIYDLVSGDKVLEGFDKAYQAYGYIYVVNGSETTIYEAE